MIRPPLPIEGLEPDAAEAFAQGESPGLAVDLSAAISLKRIADALAELAVTVINRAEQ
jgi:hypothetical protein